MTATLRELWLFFQRDLRIASTYRSPFILEIVQALFGAALFYYVAQFVDSPELRHALPQGTSYFAYSLVGFIFFDYLGAALDSIDRSLEEARDAGTLEPLLVTQVSLPVALIGSAVYPFVATTFALGVCPRIQRPSARSLCGVPVACALIKSMEFKLKSIRIALFCTARSSPRASGSGEVG